MKDGINMNILNSIDGFLDKIFGVVEPYFVISVIILAKLILICLIGLLVLLVGLLIYYVVMACITKVKTASKEAENDYKIIIKRG